MENYTTSNIAGRYTFRYYVTGMFYFDGEKNIPTYFSSINLLISATLLFLIARYVKFSTQPQYHRKWSWLGWIFVWLAMDELFALHEVTAKPMRLLLQKALQQENLGMFHFAWFVPYGFAVLCVGFYYKNFLFSLPKKTFYSFLVAGVTFMAGAVGMEMVSGFVVNNGLLSIYKIITTLEESLELLGIIYFIYSLVQYLEGQTNLRNVTIHVTVDEPSAPVAKSEGTSSPSASGQRNLKVTSEDIL
ncbi:multidrug transporter [Rufibacter sediminis]